ncbi:MAG: cell division protein FtsQ/DivIB [Pseudomonadota bacterium]
MRPVRLADPAPSRLAYRAQRMWLTPAFRWLLRFGIPFGAITSLVVWAMAVEDRRIALYGWVEEMVREVQQRPEFMVTLLAIDGASSPVAAEIREVLPVNLPASSFDIDLKELRKVVADVPAVATADLRIKTGGVLEVAVREHSPAALWRGPEGLTILSRDGSPIGSIERRAQRADLPLLAGAGADEAVGQALDLIAAAEPFSDRIRGFRRMGERRWDVVLDRGQIIQLPEERPGAAIDRILTLDRAQDLLARDVAVLDFRNRDRATIRLNGSAVDALRAIRLIETGTAQP